MNYVTKIFNLLETEGTFQLFLRICKHVRIKTLPYFEYWFDLKHGVDTCATMFHNEMSDIRSDAKKTAVRYEATPVNAVISVLEQLSIDHSKYTFVDYGSGKGRVLLLASEYPFNKIIVVELSKRLNDTAERNFKLCKRFDRVCTNVELCCADATQFKIPVGPLVIFFFTPFLGTTMDQVVSNIQESLNVTPRPIHIVYYGSRDDIISLLSNMNLNHQVLYSKRPFSVSGNYKAHLFSSRNASKQSQT